MNSERLSDSARGPMVLAEAVACWGWATAEAASSAILEKGSLRGWASSSRIASWVEPLPQKPLMTLSARAFTVALRMPLAMMKYQDRNDIATRVTKTTQPSQSKF